MNLKQLEAFLRVADLQSFTGAAKQLFMSQPAVSFQIKALEDELKVVLFQRHDKKVYLTEAGRLLYPRAREILTHYHKVIEDLDNLKGLKIGKLNIGASTIPGEYILPLFMGGFSKVYPGIKIKLRVGGSGDVINWVNNKEVALGVTGTKVEGSWLECEPWLDDELVLIAPVTSYWNKRRKISLEELTGYPLILREPGSGTRKTMENSLREKGITLDQCRVVLEIGSTRSVITAVQAGLGLSFVSRWAIQESLKLNKIYTIEVPQLHLGRQLYLIRNIQALGGGFAATAFVEYLEDRNTLKSLGF